VNEAISSVWPFEEHFKDFAVMAWDSDLPREGGTDVTKPGLQQLDGDLPRLRPAEGPTTVAKYIDDLTVHPDGLQGQPEGTPPIERTDAVPRLGVRYRSYDLDDSVQQLVVDFSGLQPADALDVEAVLHVRDVGWVRRSLSDGETTFCRDIPEEDLDGLLLVFADSSYTDVVQGSYTVEPLSTPCIGWYGTTTGTEEWHDAHSDGRRWSSFTGFFRAARPQDGRDPCEDSEPVPCIPFYAQGTIMWSTTANGDYPECPLDASGSHVAGAPEDHGYQVLWLWPVNEEQYAYSGAGGWTMRIEDPAFGCAPAMGGMGLPPFFSVPSPYEEGTLASIPPSFGHLCHERPWRIDRYATEIVGSCLAIDTPSERLGYEWHLTRVGE
jgi:hypothetical protein